MRLREPFPVIARVAPVRWLLLRIPGSEELLGNVLVTLQAVVAQTIHRGDPLTSITAGGATWVFLTLNGLHIVTVGRRGECREQLMRFAEVLYGHVLFTLTGDVLRRLQTDPGIDVGSMMRGTAGEAAALVHSAQRSSSWMLRGLPMMGMLASTRAALHSALDTVDIPGTVYTLLSVGGEIAAFTQPPHGHALAPLDAGLLLAAVQANPAARMGDSWVPVCLPCLSSDGIVQVGIVHLASLERGARRSCPPSTLPVRSTAVSPAQRHGGSATAAGAASLVKRSASERTTMPVGARRGQLSELLELNHSMVAEAASALATDVDKDAEYVKEWIDEQMRGVQGGPPADSAEGSDPPPSAHDEQAPAVPGDLESGAVASGEGGATPDQEQGVEPLLSKQLVAASRDDVFFICVTQSLPSDGFGVLQSVRQKLGKSLEGGSLALKALAERVQVGGIDAGHVGFPGLLHFSYLWKPIGQCVSTALPAGLTSDEACVALHRRYAHLAARLEADTPTLRHVVDGRDASVLHAGIHTQNAILLATWQRGVASSARRRRGSRGWATWFASASQPKTERGAGDIPRLMEALAKKLKGRHDRMFVDAPPPPKNMRP